MHLRAFAPTSQNVGGNIVAEYDDNGKLHDSHKALMILVRLQHTGSKLCSSDSPVIERFSVKANGRLLGFICSYCGTKQTE